MRKTPAVVVGIAFVAIGVLSVAGSLMVHATAFGASDVIPVGTNPAACSAVAAGVVTVILGIIPALAVGRFSREHLSEDSHAVSFILPQHLRLMSWLSLHENSPSFS